MQVNLSKVYTKNGSRLISKLRTSLAYEKTLKGNYSKEIVNIETAYGKGHTIVTSFFDSNNMLAKRIIEKNMSKNNIKKTVFTYDGFWRNRRKTIIEKFDNNRKFETIIKSEILSKVDDNPILTRIVLSRIPNNKGKFDTQFIEELSTNNHRKYIKTTAIRDKFGTLFNKTIEANVGNIKQLAKTPYLYFRSYPIKDFLISVIQYAKIKQKVQNRDIKSFFMQISDGVAANSRSFEGKGTVTFDLSKLIVPSYIVATVNHEFRHQYQNQVIDEFLSKSLKSLVKKIFKPLKYIFALKCNKGFRNYVSQKIDKKKYYNNFVEIDARKAASKARKEFLRESAMLDDLFPHSKELFTGNEQYFEYINKLDK